MAEANVVSIDGSILEGGGQILRNTASLSCLLGQPVHINKIRAGRSKGGLRPQHLSGLQLIADVCKGRLEGGQVESTEVTLWPGQIQAGSYLADTKTAGSICLLLQAALPCLLYTDAPTDLVLKGGTNADMAPPIDYFTWVFGPITEKFGVKFDCDIKRRGYFPKGGGEVKINVHPVSHLKPVDITDFGEITKISGEAFVAGALPLKVSQIMARTAEQTLRRQYRDVEIHIDAIQVSNQHAVGTGTGIIVVAETSTGCRLAGSALGKRGVPAEKVGQEAADSLLKNLSFGCCVDEHLQDQLIILMALAKGKSRVSCGPQTLHTQTAIHIAETLTKAKFEITQQGRDKYIIECEGIGLENKQLPS